MAVALRKKSERTDRVPRSSGNADSGSASEAAYSGILDLVLSHDLRPGERTSVNLLAERLGLGRMPVKEAINRLQSEGVLSVKGRSGTTVTAIDAAAAIHMFAFRHTLEDFAAETAGNNVTAAELAEIRTLLKEMRVASIDAPNRPGAGPRFVKANTAFHTLVVGAAHNPFLDQAYARLQLQFQIVSYLTRSGQDMDAAQRRQREHEEIADALAAGDTKALRDAQRRHASFTERSLLKHLK
jgi:DNA-binding GntR family transcriptional regulator